MRINILKEVNKVYANQNPSIYLRKYHNLNKFIANRKNFLLKLKLTPRLFYKTKTIDFGSGSGQNTLVYDWLGSQCTLVEYDKNYYANSIKLSKKSINSFVPKKINIFKKIYPEKYINLNLGDICIFDENLIHKTNKNITNKIRFAGIIRLR